MQPSNGPGTLAAGSLELRVLGPVEAVVDGQLVDLGSPKQRALLALLVSRVGRPVAVDVLLEELWPRHAPPPAAMASLRTYVCNLRRVLERCCQLVEFWAIDGRVKAGLDAGSLSGVVFRRLRWPCR